MVEPFVGTQSAYIIIILGDLRPLKSIFKYYLVSPVIVLIRAILFQTHTVTSPFLGGLATAPERMCMHTHLCRHLSPFPHWIPLLPFHFQA